MSVFLDFLLEGTQGEEGHITSENRFVFPRFPLVSMVTWDVPSTSCVYLAEMCGQKGVLFSLLLRELAG